MSGNGGEIVYIPFVLDSTNYVNSLLAVTFNPTDTIFRMIYAANYRKFGYDSTNKTKWSAWDAFNVFTSFDNSIFGYTKFLILDSNLYKAKNDSSLVIATRVSNSFSQNKGAKAATYAIDCTTWEICNSDGGGCTGRR